MLASWLIASKRLASLEVVGDNAAYMCLIFHTSSTRVTFISRMSAALSCLPYVTLPSLNGSPPPDDDDDDDDEQDKNMSPYLIHTSNWQRHCRKECKKKKAKKVNIKKPPFVCHFRLLVHTHTLSLSIS